MAASGKSHTSQGHAVFIGVTAKGPAILRQYVIRVLGVKAEPRNWRREVTWVTEFTAYYMNEGTLEYGKSNELPSYVAQNFVKT